MNIVVIGSINTDLVINTNRMPKIGETISGNGFAINCGGKGVNQAVAAAKLGGNVVLTLGAEGSMYTDGNDIKHQRAYKAEVVDTTAAGDTFIGAFCMKMKDSIETAVEYATAASSIAVSRRGASDSIPTNNEIEKLIYC